MKPLALHPASTRRGAALLLALWAVFVLSAAIVIWAGYIRQTLVVAGNQQNDTDARAQAHSGIWLGLHPLVTKATPVLTDYSQKDPGFTVQLVSEGSKLNINWLLGNGQGDPEPRKRDILERWLESRGIDFESRARMIDCMLDWIDPDNVKRSNGQEDSLGYHPQNRGSFLDVDEIAQVAGTEPLTSQPGWQNDLTVDSNGPIDLTNADEDVMRLLPGLGDAGIERFITWRRGDDGIDGTLDDPVISKVEDVQSFLGLSKSQWTQLSGLVSIKDTTWRIIAQGWSGNVRRQVEVVAVKGGQNPQIKRWKE